MSINRQVLEPLLVNEPLMVVGRDFGEEGTSRFKTMLAFLKRCAQHSRVDGASQLLVFSLWQSDAAVDALRLQYAQSFRFGVSHRGLIADMSVEIREDGTAFIWAVLPAEVAAKIAGGMAYRLRAEEEIIEVKGKRHSVPKVIEGAVSQFLVNNFTSLEEALFSYRDQMARTSRCYTLQEAWDDRETRIWFRPKPEYILRRALCNYLVACLRQESCELRPEQNVNERNPVDIKALWRMENRSAIIEIKWIGRSVVRKGKGRRFTVNHTARRANHGAKQLANYIEEYRRGAPEEDVHAYLVVFDCRRQRVAASAKSVDRAQGMYFEKCEIDYKPPYHRQRPDFKEPVRMFLEPHII
jgi:hypothetical protein